MRPACSVGWFMDWACDPSARRAWHVSGAYACVRGTNAAGLPVVRLERQRLVDRRVWDVDALRTEALVIEVCGFDGRRLPDRPGGRANTPWPPAGAQATLQERRYWLTDAEAAQVDALLRRLRQHLL